MLETALENMDRVDAFIMLRNHRSPGNVFEEAHRCVLLVVVLLVVLEGYQPITCSKRLSQQLQHILALSCDPSKQPGCWTCGTCS